MYYPISKTITAVLFSYPNTIITLLETQDYTVGQVVTFRVTQDWGTTQLNGLYGTIVAINQPDALGGTNTITVAIDSTGFTPFVTPAPPFINVPQVLPVGEAARSPFENVLADATRDI